MKNGIFTKWYQWKESQSQIVTKTTTKMGPRRKPLIDSGHVDHFLSDAHTRTHTFNCETKWKHISKCERSNIIFEKKTHAQHYFEKERKVTNENKLM